MLNGLLDATVVVVLLLELLELGLLIEVVVVVVLATEGALRTTILAVLSMIIFVFSPLQWSSL